MRAVVHAHAESVHQLSAQPSGDDRQAGPEQAGDHRSGRGAAYTRAAIESLDQPRYRSSAFDTCRSSPTSGGVPVAIALATSKSTIGMGLSTFM